MPTFSMTVTLKYQKEAGKLKGNVIRKEKKENHINCQTQGPMHLCSPLP
jgi:hypothetical protein